MNAISLMALQTRLQGLVMGMWVPACVAIKTNNVTKRAHCVSQMRTGSRGNMTMGHPSGGVRAPISLGKTRHASPLPIVRLHPLLVRTFEDLVDGVVDSADPA